MSPERALVCPDCEDQGREAPKVGTGKVIRHIWLPVLRDARRQGDADGLLEQVGGELMAGGCHTCGRGLT